MSLNHHMALNKPKASPIGKDHKGKKLMVLAITKAPSSSHTHIPIPIRFIDYENEASILHLRRPGAGLCQYTSRPTVEKELDNIGSFAYKAGMGC